MARYEFSLVPDIAEIPRLMDWIEGCFAADRLADDLAFKVSLAVEEAVMNVISHAFAGLPAPHAIRICLDLGTAAITAEIVDNGRPFDPLAAAAPDLTLPLGERDPGGLGIHLIRTMIDRVDYRRSGGENILRLEKSRG